MPLVVVVVVVDTVEMIRYNKGVTEHHLDQIGDVARGQVFGAVQPVLVLLIFWFLLLLFLLLFLLRLFAGQLVVLCPLKEAGVFHFAHDDAARHPGDLASFASAGHKGSERKSVLYRDTTAWRVAA